MRCFASRGIWSCPTKVGRWQDPQRRAAASSAPRWTSDGSIGSPLGLGGSLAKWLDSASSSSSLRSLTNGVITSIRRTPSRIRSSWFSTKNSGWPASDGMFSMRELPSSPWQAPQSWIRSASGMLWANAAPMQKMAAASPRTDGRHQFEMASITPSLLLRLSSLRSGVGDAVGRTVLLVGNQHRAVRQLQDIGGPAVELVLAVVEETGHERLDLGGRALRPGKHHVIAVLLLPVPRPAAGNEADVRVGLGEHAAGVELDAEPGDMRSRQGGRQYHAGARVWPLDVRIGNAVGVAIGEAEIGAFLILGNPVELVLRAIIAGPVAAVVGELQLLLHRMPVEADGVAYAARDDLHAGAVGVVAADLAVGAGVDLANVAVRADLHIELAVGPERDVLPIVMDGVREIEPLRQLDRLAGIVELVLDVVVTEHLVDSEHVKRAVLERQPVGLGQSRQQGLDLALAVLVGDGIDAADQPRAHEHGALVAHHHRARGRMAVRPDLGLEAGRQLELVDRDLLERRHRGRRRMGPEVAVLIAGSRLRFVERTKAGRRLGDRRPRGGHQSKDSGEQ